ncbi:TPA: Lar family restriction alleviation protein [Pseudomonas putida]|uniref:Lar family restriction alleviation protein n=1 Tax=Pseudomonas putida TaxID=303 RepID=UPI0023637F90|nr:hypothetical protein [Pseudomonas putida]MDD2009615.1 hypothetical protein [Pseudomonas putida]HDS1779415.1 Lar family restriction alleviation protein [Pseudomonas putida]
MPTENRSSNTQMAAQLSPCPHCGQQDAFVEQLDSDASVVICQGRIDEHSACLARGPVGVQQHECEDQPGYDQAVKEWNKRAAAVPHPDPIAWMVGTAIWWTKEEAERDAAETGLPIVGLGAMTCSASSKQHQAEPVAWLYSRPDGQVEPVVTLNKANASDRGSWDETPLYAHADPGEVERLRAELVRMNETNWRASQYSIKLQAQLTEAQALLRDNSGKLIRMAAHLISAPLFALQDLQDEDKKMTRARVDTAVDTADARLKDAAYELRRIADALSASARPSSPTWSCQACQVEQPTDRACDACGGKTEPAGAHLYSTQL